jgi:hypothetical protein
MVVMEQAALELVGKDLLAAQALNLAEQVAAAEQAQLVLIQLQAFLVMAALEQLLLLQVHQ